MKRTYIDSGILIAATRGIDPIAQKALTIFDDPEREFASSIFEDYIPPFCWRGHETKRRRARPGVD